MIAFGVRLFTDRAKEWQIDSEKKYTTKLKEEGIEHSSLTSVKKDNQKRLWIQWNDEPAKGFKEVQRKEGRMS